MTIILPNIAISGYRSFGAKPAYFDKFSNINIFIGKNNAGKSNVLRLLKEVLAHAGDSGSIQLETYAKHLPTQPPLMVGCAEEIDLDESVPRLPENGERLKLLREHGRPQVAALVAKVLKSKSEVDRTSFNGKSIAWSFTTFPDRRISDDSWPATLRKIHPDDLELLGKSLTGVVAGGNQAFWESEIPKRLALNFPSFKVALIPAVRRIGEHSNKHEGFDGHGIIDRLARLERPNATTQSDKRIFNAINEFLRDVTDSPNARIEIPHERDTILIHMDDKVLPIECLGSGLHEVIILAAAATTLDKQIVCIEEPELHLNPILQKKLMRYLSTKTSNQYFITTHSAALMDTPGAEIYHITLQDGASCAERVTTDSSKRAVCEDLGYHPSDLLQANCIIWVEGPSDRLYLNWWLKSLGNEFQEGILWDLANSTSSNPPNGWGGMLAGRLNASSSLPGLPPCISISGQTRFLVGKYNNNLVINPFRLSTSAATPAGSISNYSATDTNNFQSARRAALDEMLALTYPHVFSNEMADITERALTVGASVNALIGTGGAFNAIPGGVVFPNTDLGNQLAQVVRMINASKNSSLIAANRQIFYVNSGGSFGWDSHNGQMPSNVLTAGHQGLLQSVSACVAAFYRALVAMNLHNEVMLFSASEFGRTINSNGEGTDHGWGGVQFVMGGGQGVPTGQIGGLPVGANDQGNGPLLAYNPQTSAGSGIYGRYPRIINNASDSAAVPNAEKGESFSRGQFIPTTSSEQYAATLARWMGLRDADAPILFPNVDRYDDFTLAQGNLCAYTGRYVPFINGIS